MTAVSHQLNYAMLGREVPILIQSLPRADGDSHGSFRPDTRNQAHRSIRGTDDPLSTLVDINGGVRGVMPCKGASSVGGVGGASYILRRPAIPYQGGMYPSQGYARSQQKGLAYLVGKPINQPLMPIADSFNAGLTSRLGQPKSLEMK